MNAYTTYLNSPPEPVRISTVLTVECTLGAFGVDPVSTAGHITYQIALKKCEVNIKPRSYDLKMIDPFSYTYPFKIIELICVTEYPELVALIGGDWVGEVLVEVGLPDQIRQAKVVVVMGTLQANLAITTVNNWREKQTNKHSRDRV